MTIPTSALRQLAEASAAHVADPNNDNYGPYLMRQAEVAWGSPATVAAVSGELLRLRALRVALVEWRKRLAAYEAELMAEPWRGGATSIRAANRETEARATLDAALRECEA